MKKHAGLILVHMESISYTGNKNKKLQFFIHLDSNLIFRPLLIIVISNIAMYIYASIILKKITKRTASLKRSSINTSNRKSIENDDDSDNVKRQFSRALSRSVKRTRHAAKVEK